jgi:hypothetical protein
MDEMIVIVLDQVPTAALHLRGHPMDPQDTLMAPLHTVLLLMVLPVTVLPVTVSMVLLAAPLTALMPLMDLA